MAVFSLVEIVKVSPLGIARMNAALQLRVNPDFIRANVSVD